MYRYKRYLLIVLLFSMGITACKKWDDHVKTGYQDLEHNLLQTIEADPALSKFREYIGKTGVDTVLQSSKAYTVWAPTNDALNTLDPAIVADLVKLKAFVLNHISNLSYFKRDAAIQIRVPALSGKYHNFSATKFDDANMVTADKYVRNGVLHTIDKGVLVLQNIWDFINFTKAQYLQNDFIASKLNFNFFDSTKATIDSISSTTGQPIYHPGTGFVLKNQFNERVYNTTREDKQYTYLVIQDPNFTVEVDSLKPYYATGNVALTDSLARWNTVKDLIIDGYYGPTALVGLLSRFGTPLPIDAGLIVETRKLSNGVAYILSKVNVLTADKFKQIFVQGESPSGFLIDRTANTNYRIRYNPVTTLNFIDIMVTGHGVTAFYSYYRLNETPTIKYRVFASAINDFQATAFAQSIAIKSFVAPSTYTTLATLAHNVPLYTAAGAYNELLLGEFTPTSYGTIEIQLTATTTGPIVLDYLRLVPVP